MDEFGKVAIHWKFGKYNKIMERIHKQTFQNSNVQGTLFVFISTIYFGVVFQQ